MRIINCQSAEWSLVDVQSHAMPEAVDVALQRILRVELRLVALGLEILAGHALVILERRVQVKVFQQAVEDFLHLPVQFLRFGRGVAETPGAREIVEISTAALGRINIVNDGLAESHQVGGVACGVRHARVAPDGKDEAFGQFRAALCHPQADPGLDIPHCQRRAVFLEQDFVGAHLARGQILRGAADDFNGEASHLADALHVTRVLRLHGADEDRVHPGFADQFQVGQEALEMSQRGENAADLHMAVHTHAPFRHSEISQNPLKAKRADQRQIAIRLLEKFFIRIRAQGFCQQAGFGGFVALHVIIKKNRFLAALLHQHRRANMPAACEIIHGRVVLGRAQNEKRVEIAFLHEGINV